MERPACYDLCVSNVRTAVSQNTVRFRLRNATAATHERMHALKPFRDLHDRVLALADYRRLIAGTQYFHSAACDTVRAAGIAAHASSARRLGLLALDLDYLNVAVIPSGRRQCASVPAALGWLYVAEGSMLGGKVIARQLDYLFGRSSDGRRFFSGTPEDASSWRLLCRHLDGLDADEDEVEQMIAGAEAGFAFFEASLGKADCL